MEVVGYHCHQFEYYQKRHMSGNKNTANIFRRKEQITVQFLLYHSEHEMHISHNKCCAEGVDALKAFFLFWKHLE